MYSKFAEQKMETPDFKEALSAYLKDVKAFSWISEKYKTAAFKAGAAFVYDTSAEHSIFNEFLAKVFVELGKQDNKWGAQRNYHPLEWQSILIEEVGEVGKAINDGDWATILPENYEEELIQVAAVVFRMYLRNKGETPKKHY